MKRARFSKKRESADEAKIMKDLKQFVKDPSDCFMVDQLLFLEEQAKLWYKNIDSTENVVKIHMETEKHHGIINIETTVEKFKVLVCLLCMPLHSG